MRNRSGGADSDWLQPRIFVARPFDESGQRIFDSIIAPSLAVASLKPVHGPSCHNDDAVKRVSAAIAECGAVLAVLIGQNRNVFIEAGIAIALDKPLLLLADTPQDCGMLHGSFPLVLKRDRVALRRALKDVATRIAPLVPLSGAIPSRARKREGPIE
jgi:hypothetical protein